MKVDEDILFLVFDSVAGALRYYYFEATDEEIEYIINDAYNTNRTPPLTYIHKLCAHLKSLREEA